MPYHKGMPQNPATETDQLAKFEMCAGWSGVPVLAALNRVGTRMSDLMALVGERK